METPYPQIIDLLTGHERRGGNRCWRPRGTPTPLLIHTRSGQGAVRIAGSHEQHTISAGDTVLWTAGAHQEFGSDRDADPREIVWAHFRPRPHWHEWRRWPWLGAGVARIPAPQPRLQARIDTALMEMNASTDGVSPRATDFALNALERALLWLDTANPGPQQRDNRIHEAVLFIARNLAGPLSVRAIADAVALSPSRFSHLSPSRSESRPRASSSSGGSSAPRPCSRRARCRSARSQTPPASVASSTSPPGSRRWPG